MRTIQDFENTREVEKLIKMCIILVYCRELGIKLEYPDSNPSATVGIYIYDADSYVKSSSKII